MLSYRGYILDSSTFAERHPWLFSILVVLLIFIVNGVGVAFAMRLGFPPTTYAAYSELALVVFFVLIVSGMRWWGRIGFHQVRSPQAIALYLPAFIPVLGNLIFGVRVRAVPAVLAYLLLASAVGFVEETAFRGLILRAFRPRGRWTAVLVSAGFFGFAHGINILAGSNDLYVLVQIGYALAIGFGFAAMALRGGVIWPLMVAHALTDFAAFINSNQIGGSGVDLGLILIASFYILVFVGYGIFLLRKPTEQVSETI